MIYTYSPNWYRSQCLEICSRNPPSKNSLVTLEGSSVMYYGSNHHLYEYCLRSKRVTAELNLNKFIEQSIFSEKKREAQQSLSSNHLQRTQKSYQQSLDSKDQSQIPIKENIKISSLKYFFDVANQKRFLFVGFVGLNQMAVIMIENRVELSYETKLTIVMWIELRYINDASEIYIIDQSDILTEDSLQPSKIRIIAVPESQSDVYEAINLTTPKAQDNSFKYDSFKVSLNEETNFQEQKKVQMSLKSSTQTKIKSKNKLKYWLSLRIDQKMHSAAFLSKNCQIVYFYKNSLNIKPTTLSTCNGQSILAVDHHQVEKFDLNTNQKLKDPKIAFAILSRSKKEDKMFITVIEMQFEKDNLQQPSINTTHKFGIRISYPKKMYHKVAQEKTNRRSGCICIKLISAGYLIVTGNLGEIFTINLSMCAAKKIEQLQLRPYSYVQQNEGAISDMTYIVWSDSRHYKDIFGIYVHEGRLYCIGTDYTLTVWKIPEKQENLFKEFGLKQSMKFLTSGVEQIVSSDCDPGMVFLKLKDSIIRSCDISDSNAILQSDSQKTSVGSYLTEYYRHTKKFNSVKRICMHTTEIGLVGMLSEDGRIILYDLYEDRLIKVISFFKSNVKSEKTQIKASEINTFSFEQVSICQSLNQLNGAKVFPSNTTSEHHKEGSTQTITALSTSHYIREIDCKVVIVVQMQSCLLLVSKLGDNASVQCQVIPKIGFSKLQRIFGNIYWNESFLLSTKKTQNKIELKVGTANEVFEVQEELILGSGSRCVFRHQEKAAQSKGQKENLIWMLSYKLNKMVIYLFALRSKELQQKGISELQKIGQTRIINLPSVAECVVFSNDFQSPEVNQCAVFYNKKEEKLFRIDLEKVHHKISKKNSDQFASNSQVEGVEIQTHQIHPSKIQMVSVFNRDMVVLATKDQTVRVVQLKNGQQCVKETPQKFDNHSTFKSRNKEKKAFQKRE